MDQRSVWVESMERKPTAGNFEQPKESGLSATHGQRILIPEVSNLITSVNQLTSQNFELLKMARLPEKDFGMGLRMDLRLRFLALRTIVM